MNQIEIEIKKIAEKIISNKIDLIEGCHLITEFSYKL